MGVLSEWRAATDCQLLDCDAGEIAPHVEAELCVRGQLEPGVLTIVTGDDDITLVLQQDCLGVGLTSRQPVGSRCQHDGGVGACLADHFREVLGRSDLHGPRLDSCRGKQKAGNYQDLPPASSRFKDGGRFHFKFNWFRQNEFPQLNVESPIPFIRFSGQRPGKGKSW